MLILILGVVWAIITQPWTWFKNNKEQPVPSPGNLPAPTDQGTVTFTLPAYEDLLATKIAETETKLKSAHDEEKILLTQQIEELRKRAANPEPALKEARATITKLEAALTREGNDIGEQRMAEARKALEAGDFSIADDIFADIEDREMLAVERTARAAFARGEIAEQDIRWADAAKHYTRAARLNPTYESLYSAHEFAWRSGDYDKAIPLGIDLLKLAKTEFGETHEKYAAALNGHALSLKATGKYEQAEPLYLQAIQILETTLGPEHPNTKTVKANYESFLKARGK